MTEHKRLERPDMNPFYILSNYLFVRFGNEKNRFLPLQPSGNLQKRLDFRVWQIQNAAYSRVLSPLRCISIGSNNNKAHI
jgi:hypothetical protein